MITNRSPYWLTVCADLEQEDPLFVRSHVSSEFLEATCECSNGSTANGSAAADPFYLTPAQRSALHATSTSRTGRAPWDLPTASPDPCPMCGERPWWAHQEERISAQQDEDETLEEMYDWK